MRLERDPLEVFINAVAGFWGGLLLAIVTAFFYFFYCAVVMSLFMFTGHEHRSHIALPDMGCFEFIFFLLVVIYCFKFAKNSDSRAVDMCVACMAIAVNTFLVGLDVSAAAWRGAAALVIMLATPLAVLWIFSAIQRRRVNLLNAQADELERRRIMGKHAEFDADTEFTEQAKN